MSDTLWEIPREPAVAYREQDREEDAKSIPLQVHKNPLRIVN